MNNIDEKILEALNSEDKKVMDDYGEELGFWGLIGESFRGKMKGVVFTVLLFLLLFAVIFWTCVIHFFSVEGLEMKLNYLAGGLTALIMIVLCRLWYSMELNRLSVVREVKRLELQVSLLAKKL